MGAAMLLVAGVVLAGCSEGESPTAQAARPAGVEDPCRFEAREETAKRHPRLYAILRNFKKQEDALAPTLAATQRPRYQEVLKRVHDRQAQIWAYQCPQLLGLSQQAASTNE